MADPDGLDDHPHLSGAWLRDLLLDKMEFSSWFVYLHGSVGRHLLVLDRHWGANVESNRSIHDEPDRRRAKGERRSMDWRSTDTPRSMDWRSTDTPLDTCHRPFGVRGAPNRPAQKVDCRSLARPQREGPYWSHGPSAAC